MKTTAWTRVRSHQDAMATCGNMYSYVHTRGLAPHAHPLAASRGPRSTCCLNKHQVWGLTPPEGKEPALLRGTACSGPRAGKHRDLEASYSVSKDVLKQKQSHRDEGTSKTDPTETPEQKLTSSLQLGAASTHGAHVGICRHQYFTKQRCQRKRKGPQKDKRDIR